MYCPNGLLCWKRVCICVARYMCNASIPIWYLLNIFIVARDIVCYSIRWQCHGDLRSQPHPCIPIGLVSYFVCFCKHWTTCHTAYASSRLAVAAHSFQTTLFDECFVFQRWCFLLFVCLLLLVSMRSMASWIVSQIEWVLKQRFGIRANWYYHFDWSNSRMSMEMMLLCSTISFSNAGCAVHVCAECASW